MPKIHPAVAEHNRRLIEEAALRLFCRQGFHGTTIRQIASDTRISTGNIYNYYRTKDEILSSLISSYHQRMMEEKKALLNALSRPFDRQGLKQLAAGIRSLIQRHGDYWRLMYVDATECENRHFMKYFPHFLDDFRDWFSNGPWAGQEHPQRPEDDPVFLFGAIWMQFFNYYLVEYVFHGQRHFGISDDEFVERICRIYLDRNAPLKREKV